MYNGSAVVTLGGTVILQTISSGSSSLVVMIYFSASNESRTVLLMPHRYRETTMLTP